MRLWTLSPAYLDARGLVACWREALLAQHVLMGETKGYRHHPQLERFKDQLDPLLAIGAYLRGLHSEAVKRGYRFDESRIQRRAGSHPHIPVTGGQVEFEYGHLLKKLQERDPQRARILSSHVPGPPTWKDLALHPLFHAVEGAVEPWERP